MQNLNIKILILFTMLLSKQFIISMEEPEDNELEISVQEQQQSKLESCCICLDEIDPEKSEDIIVFLCNHYLHNECFYGWQQKSSQNACPFCRAPMIRAFRTFNDVMAHQKLSIATECITKLQKKINELEIHNSEETLHVFGRDIAHELKQIKQLILEKVAPKTFYYPATNEESESEQEYQGLTSSELQPIGNLNGSRQNLQRNIKTNFLYEAIMNDSAEQIILAVNTGANVNRNQNPPILFAINHNKPNALKELLRLGSKFNFRYLNHALQLNDRQEIVNILSQHQELSNH